MDDILDEPQYENKEIEPASLMDRLVATLTDISFFFGTTYFVNKLFIGEEYGDFLFNNWYIFALLLLFYIIYFQSSEKQATLGMQLMNIRLLGEDKTDATVNDVIRRSVINIVLFLNFLILTGRYNQSLADRRTRIIVIKR